VYAPLTNPSFPQNLTVQNNITCLSTVNANSLSVYQIVGRSPDTIIYITPNTPGKASYFTDNTIWLGTNVSVQGALSSTGDLTCQALTANGNTLLNGSLTAGAISCSGEMFITGTKATSKSTKGVLLGTESSGNAAVEIISDTAKISYIDFSSTSTDFRGRILYDNSAITMSFHSNANTTARMTVQANGTVNIPTLTGTSKSFDIPHEIKGGSWILRHRVVEGERAQNLYRYQLNLAVGETQQVLPEYNRFLNTNYQVFISPNGHFGIGYGDVVVGETEINLVLNVNQAGTYNIMVVADRKDPGALDEFSTYGVEYNSDLV
jgi:hypothetical protein